MLCYSAFNSSLGLLQPRLRLPPERRSAPAKRVLTVSSHNFKSQNFKLSVSNPKSKYVAYLSVLSKFQIARV